MWFLDDYFQKIKEKKLEEDLEIELKKPSLEKVIINITEEMREKCIFLPDQILHSVFKEQELLDFGKKHLQEHWNTYKKTIQLN